MKAHEQCKWAFFHGYICQANDDGSIPMNSLALLDCRYAREEDAKRVVEIHNELLERLRIVEGA